MHFTKKDILGLDKINRLNLINTISGIKPANLIGTISENNTTNLAIFSSVIHLGSNPPLLGIIVRPNSEVKRHTYQNIKSTGFYTINHVSTAHTKEAHYTSAKFNENTSEFAMCGFNEMFIDGFTAPFVKESNLKIGLKYVESIKIEINGTHLVIGSIEHIIFPNELMNESGQIDLSEIDSTGVSGLNYYYSLKKINDYPYARVDDAIKLFKK